MSFNAEKAREFIANSDYIVASLQLKSKELANLSKYEFLRQSIISLTEAYFQASSIEVHFFGSRVIGVATEESDMDIFVEINNSYYSAYSVSSQHDQRYQKLANAFEKNADWIVKERVLRTAVPIIICVFKPLNMMCDINITNGISVANSKMIGHLFSIQPEAVKLFHFIRRWMKVQGFDLFKGYTITLLVIFYLQSKNLMPTAEVVQSGVYQRTIEGLKVEFNCNRGLSDYKTDVMYDYKEHIASFFKFFANHDFSQVMSTSTGHSYPMSSYKMRHPKFLLKGIFIAGPIKVGKNCGIADYGHKEKFVEFCKASNDFLVNNKI